MVKTTGPLYSAEASGTLAGQLTFLLTRRGTIARKRVRPRDPQTGAQIGHRSAFNFISKNWSTVADVDRATWSAIADPPIVTNYNAYTATNLAKWRGFLPPSQDYPIDRTLSWGTVGIGPEATDQVNQVQFRIYLSPVYSTWGIIFFASLSTGFATAVDNAISFEWCRASGNHYYTWDTPTPAAWFYNARLFTIDGNLGPELGEFVVS